MNYKSMSDEALRRILSEIEKEQENREQATLAKQYISTMKTTIIHLQSAIENLEKQPKIAPLMAHYNVKAKAEDLTYVLEGCMGDAT